MPETGDAFRHPLFDYQEAAANTIVDTWKSGIVHLPTGAGKTRVGFEIVARFLRADPNGLVIWASDRRVVVRQGMMQAAQLADLFPGARVAWLSGAQVDRPEMNENIVSAISMAFVSRRGLTRWLNRLHDLRCSACGLYLALAEEGQRRPVLIVYDECHELGAKELRKHWRRCAERYNLHGRRHMFTLIGLSATPMPSSAEAQADFQKIFFPIGSGRSPSARPEWRVHVHTSVSMKALTDRQVLCPVNTYFNDSGEFDISDVAAEAAALWARDLARYGRLSRPNRKQVGDFFDTFNRKVMSDKRVLAVLAKRIGDRLPELGKTIVYCPTIRAANLLAAILHNHPNVGRGKVALVHSRMDDLEDAPTDSEIRDPNAILGEFRRRGDEPCILINVGMATVGFDDPRVKTIVLARLTHSRNLYWQMIGRGLRGPKVGGTPYCNVIDPVRLTDKWGIYEGYRPRIHHGGLPERDLEAKDAARMDLEELAPVVISVDPTDPQPPDEDPFDRRVRQEAASAVRAFMRGDHCGANLEALFQSCGIRTDIPEPDRRSDLPAIPASQVPVSQEQVLELRFRACEAKLQATLDWLRKYIPHPVGSTDQWIRALALLDLVERFHLRDEGTFLFAISQMTQMR